VLRTELDHAVVEPVPAARIAAAPHPAAPAVAAPRPRAHISPGPVPAAHGGRVTSPGPPQPPQPGDEPPIYDDGVLRITRIPGPGPGPSPVSGPDPSPGPGYALAGEIDEYTVCGLAAKLAELAANLDEVHLDLGTLAYSDLAGLRVIVQLAAGRRRVVLHRVPPHLRAVLAIVGWDTVPGLELAS
jgi:ABC-type transporter Mla MlaB component